VAIHEKRHADDRRAGECRVELGSVERVDQEPAVLEPDRGRGSPQELVRVGEPGEASMLIEAVRLQGGGMVAGLAERIPALGRPARG
jgi:hypothetical protein